MPLLTNLKFVKVLNYYSWIFQICLLDVQEKNGQKHFFVYPWNHLLIDFLNFRFACLVVTAAAFFLWHFRQTGSTWLPPARIDASGFGISPLQVSSKSFEATQRPSTHLSGAETPPSCPLEASTAPSACGTFSEARPVFRTDLKTILKASLRKWWRLTRQRVRTSSICGTRRTTRLSPPASGVRPVFLALTVAPASVWLKTSN